jgi:hypothetical protein
LRLSAQSLRIFWSSVQTPTGRIRSLRSRPWFGLTPRLCLLPSGHPFLPCLSCTLLLACFSSTSFLSSMSTILPTAASTSSPSSSSRINLVSLLSAARFFRRKSIVRRTQYTGVAPKVHDGRNLLSALYYGCNGFAASLCSGIGVIVPLVTSLRSILHTDPSEPQIGALKTFASLLAEQLKHSVVKAFTFLRTAPSKNIALI